MIEGCGRTLKNTQRKYCSDHAEEAKLESKRQAMVRQRRQEEADRLRAAVRRGL